MRKIGIAGLASGWLLATMATAGDAPPAAAQFGWFGTLAGSCWHGEYPGGGGDTQCYAWQYGRYLRGTIAIEAPGRDGTPFRLAGACASRT
jgi:hypothetical protein